MPAPPADEATPVSAGSCSSRSKIALVSSSLDDSERGRVSDCFKRRGYNVVSRLPDEDAQAVCAQWAPPREIMWNEVTERSLLVNHLYVRSGLVRKDLLSKVLNAARAKSSVMPETHLPEDFEVRFFILARLVEESRR